MGAWVVDATSEPGILRLTLAGRMTDDEMTEFVLAHNRPVDAYRGGDYRVFCDIRDLQTLSPASAGLFEAAKSHSADQRGFRGSAVWARGATVALQHKRTSQAGGVDSTELISEDEAALRSHLRTVRRP